MEVTDLGPTKLKNIEKPIRAYSLEVGKPAHSAGEADQGGPLCPGAPMAALLVSGVAALIAIAAGLLAFLGLQPPPGRHRRTTFPSRAAFPRISRAMRARIISRRRSD